MRAVQITRYGPPDVLQPNEVTMPDPGPGEVLVSVKACAVNAIDRLTRAGAGVPIGGFPAILGWDVSGTVAQAGLGAERFTVGEDVFGTLRFPALAQAYAEFVVAPESELARKPAPVSHAEATGAMAALTAWEALFALGHVEAGQRVVIHGAAGGFGHVAVQLARHAGAEVVATASDRNRAFLLDLGADDVVDYRRADLQRAVGTVDIAIDTRGGEDFHRLLDLVGRGGRIVTLKGRADGQAAAARRRGVTAAYAYVAPNGPTLELIAPLMEQGAVRVHIDETFGLEDAAAAHARGDAGRVRGQLALDMGR
jgi:NADPH:quinone reductase-like Zn-dependent oxidoreductase